MKKIKVIVKEKTLLELAEDAEKGDLIDLNELAEVDSSYLEAIIDSGKDKVYASKLEEFKRTLDAENLVKVNELQSTIEALKKEKDNALIIKEKEVEKQFLNQISDLNKKIAEMNLEKKNEIDKLLGQIESEKNNKQTALTLKEQEVKNEFTEKIADLHREIEVLKSTKAAEIEKIHANSQTELEKIKNEASTKYSELEQKYNMLMAQHDNQLKQSKLELENEHNKKMNEMESQYKEQISSKDLELVNMKASFEREKENALAEQKNKFNETLKEKEDVINNLQRAKTIMNVKQTGEDLESWCNNEVISYMQNGLFNCTWTKDNEVVKNEDETKGSKADYIFKVFASNKHLETELLAAVCLDMKDENPDSVNKKSNSSYYKQLDKNREKKNCKYAVLVSNLEMDKPNVLPIFKVLEYENMYVVRPAYLMVFLNMIASLTTRFADLLLSKEKEAIALKGKRELIEEFETIKDTYLDKPLVSLEKSIEAIALNSDSIKKACKNIDEQCDKVNRSYINQIVEKINKFELKLEKGIVKKLEE